MSEDSCPWCGKDLYHNLYGYLTGSLPGNYFEYQCPYCEEYIDVEVEPVPLFLLKKLEEENQDE